MDTDLDLDLDCLFEFDSPIDTAQLDTAPSPEPILCEKASVGESTENISTSQLPRLSCRGRENGLTAAGRASSMLEGSDPSPLSFTQATVELFGHVTVTCLSLQDNMASMFMCFCKQMNIVLDTVTASSDEQMTAVERCYEFLHFLEILVHRLVTTAFPGDKLIGRLASDVVARLGNAVTYPGPLNEFLATLRPNVGVGENSSHLVLQLHWVRLAILYRLTSSTVSADGPGFLTCLLGACETTIRSLLSEASVRFNQVPLASEGVATSLYPCPCAEELWLITRLILDRTSLQHSSLTFWEVMANILSELTTCSLSTSSTAVVGEDPVIFAKDALGYAWWVLARLCSLYRYSSSGKLSNQHEANTNGHWKIVQELIVKSFKQESSQLEQTLRCHLSCCLFLYQQWKPVSIQPVAIAWDYFNRHLNDSFHLPALGVRELLTAEGSSSQQWFEYCQQLSYTAPEDFSYLQGRSYELFLRMLACCLGDKDGDDQLWKQMKGRLYSKLTRRKIADLNCHGLQHLISLFLVLSLTTDMQEASQQLYSFLSIRSLTSALEKNLTVLWKGLFSLLLAHQARGVVFSVSLGNKMCEKISVISRQLVGVDARVDPVHRPLLIETLQVVLNGITEVVEFGGVAMGAESLIGNYLGDLLRLLSGKELHRILSFTSNVFLSLSSQFEQLVRSDDTDTTTQTGSLRQFSHKFWQTTSPSVIKQATDSQTSQILSSTAASMTVFTCEWLSAREARSLVDAFAFSDSVSPGMTTSFLCHVMGNEITRKALFISEHSQLLCLHAWLRCTLSFHHVAVDTSGHTPTDLQQLTRLMYKLDLVRCLVKTSTEVSEPITLFQQLLRGFSSLHNSATVIADERQSSKEQLLTVLGDVCKTMSTNLSSGDGLRVSYRIGASLFRHCPKMIYSKAVSHCLLPQLLDTLLLPPSTHKKPMTVGQASSIRAHLHHFLAGLFLLEPERDEFVSRKIKQIFSRYFHGYLHPVRPLVTSGPNPFMLLLQPCFSGQPPSAVGDQMEYVLKTISSQELTFPQHPASLLPVVQFLQQAVEKITNPQLIARACHVLLGKLLCCVLSCEVSRWHSSRENSTLRKKALESLRILLEKNRTNQEMSGDSQLLPLLRDYIITNLPLHKGSVVKPLVSIATYYPLLVKELIPMLEKAIEEQERKSGWGCDQALRSACEELKCAVKR